MSTWIAAATAWVLASAVAGGFAYGVARELSQPELGLFLAGAASGWYARRFWPCCPSRRCA